MLISKQSLKKNFVKIVLFGSIIPLCISFLFLYYLIKINKQKIIQHSTNEKHTLELSIQSSFNRIIDSLYKISSSKEMRMLFETTIQNEQSAQKKFKLFLEQEKNRVGNEDFAYCIYGAKGNLIYAEKICPENRKNILDGGHFLEQDAIFAFDMPQIFNLGNETHSITLSAVISLASIQKHYPFLKSLSFTSNELNHIQLKAYLGNDIFDKKMLLLSYFCILFCLIITVFSILYGMRTAYFLKNSAQDALKLATIGKIAHLLAHDIQKPFENIAHFSREISLCRDKKEIDALISETKHSIQASQTFIVNLLSELMDADAHSLKLQKDLSLQDILDSCFKTLPQNSLDDIKVEIILKHTLRFDGDIVKLVRSFFNIIVNAVDALKNISNQRIKDESMDHLRKIRTNSDDHLKTIRVESFDHLNYVRIIFHNSDSFISKQDIKNIFDPFFTKKSSGTGLGLAISKKMIELHKGKIFCVSKKKSGVSFIIDLPSSGDALSDSLALSTNAILRAGVNCARAHYNNIFLIDDCPLTLRAWKRKLKIKNESANIHSFLNFEDFFQFIKDKKITKREISKIICDYYMPNSCISLAEALKKIRRFYSKPIYISTHMDKLIVKNALKEFNIIVTEKQCID